MTFAEKALARAAGLPATHAGQIVDAAPNRILTHDNTAAIARIFYQELGAEKVFVPDKLCLVLDHASPPPTPQHAKNHAETRRFAKDQGIRQFFEVGRGICHQVLAEAGLALPGDLVLGADSHTTHAGWLGAFGAGIGRTEAAVLWATGKLWLRVPETIRITLRGNLPAGVTSKDLCMHIARSLGADGGLYYSIEFAGPGVWDLSVESRMVIPNTMAEIGVKNAWLPPDAKVFDWLSHRSGQTTEQLEALALYPDENAVYAAEYEINLDALEPLVACPHSVDNVKPLSGVAGQKVDMAFIGTCTNGRLEDLAAAAQVLQGRHVHPGTRLLVVPASSEVYSAAVEKGYIAALVEAGAMIGIPGCGPCMGNHLGIPAKGETVISTANRNFRGRMGEPEASIYLASPAVVAASAVLGRLGSPAEVGQNQVFHARASVQPAMLSLKKTSTLPSSVEAAPAPAGSPQVTPHLRGKAWKYGDNVNTDQIFPGKYTYTLTSSEEIAAHALEDLDSSFAASVHPGDVVIGGSNFGCGSSREQAVTCLKYKGVSALIGASFARIFYRNAINQGLPAIVCPPAVAAARPGDPVEIDLAQGLIHLPAGTFTFPAFPPNVQAILHAGGLVENIKQARSPLS
jgi:3-isopropylmalate/(R)-2-methylmalate dehydratase large subunit